LVLIREVNIYRGKIGVIKWLLRRGEEHDQLPLQALLSSYQMDAVLDAQEFLVAEMDGELVGAARLEYEEGKAYLRPVVVAANMQGQGVGRALVRALAQDLPALEVVARGKAAGFYKSLSFVTMPWEQVPGRYWQECHSCPDYEECRPEPMILHPK